MGRQLAQSYEPIDRDDAGNVDRQAKLVGIAAHQLVGKEERNEWDPVPQEELAATQDRGHEREAHYQQIRRDRDTSPDHQGQQQERVRRHCGHEQQVVASAQMGARRTEGAYRLDGLTVDGDRAKSGLPNAASRSPGSPAMRLGPEPFQGAQPVALMAPSSGPRVCLAEDAILAFERPKSNETKQAPGRRPVRRDEESSSEGFPGANVAAGSPIAGRTRDHVMGRLPARRPGHAVT